MAVFDLFSKRQKRLRGGTPDVFLYDHVPKPLRVQVMHIWMDAFGDVSSRNSKAMGIYNGINEILAREYGVLSLSDDAYDNPFEAVTKYLLSAKDDERVLDVIELSFRFIERLTNDAFYRATAHPSVLNQRRLYNSRRLICLKYRLPKPPSSSGRCKATRDS